MDTILFRPLTIANGDIGTFTSGQIETIKSGLDSMHLVLLKKQEISLTQQVDFTRHFGEIELVWEDKHPESDYVQLLKNAKKKYESFKSTSKHWHTDRSFMKTASKYTFLYAKEIGEACGGTEFCNLQQAYEDLPDDLKARLSSLNGIHSFNYLFPNLLRKKLYSEEQINELVLKYPDTKNPIVKTNSESKKKSLFLSELCLKRVEGVSETDSIEILSRLYDHALNNKYRYTHEWEQGDVLIWDNESLMHRALNTPPHVKREFHRTTTNVKTDLENLL